MFGAVVDKLKFAKKFVAHPPVKDEVRRRLHTQATDPSQQPHRWRPGSPLADAHNAHYTNTPDEFERAVTGDYNFLEGDVWLEAAVRNIPGVDHFREPIMAHDPGDVGGLTFKEWATLGQASGKGLKIDIKHSAAVPKVLNTLDELGIDDDYLIFNADMVWGPGIDKDLKLKALDVLTDFSMQVEEMKVIREARPDAVIAVSLFTGAAPPGTSFNDRQVDQAIAIARELGGPITFPLRAEFVTPAVVAKLKPHGKVSIWNDPRTYLPGDFDAARRAFRAMGVDGMIDLRATNYKASGMFPEG